MNKKHYLIMLLILLSAAVVLFYFFSGKKQKHIEQSKQQDIHQSSYIVENKQLSTDIQQSIVSEKIGDQTIPVVIYSQDKKQGTTSIETLPREYFLDVEQKKDEITPVVQIKSGDKVVTIKGKTTKLIKEKPKGIIFEPGLFASVNIDLDKKLTGNVGLSVNWLSYNDFRFLSPGLSVDSNKQINLSIAPIKYNIWRNSFIGVNVGSDIKANKYIGLDFSINF